MKNLFIEINNDDLLKEWEEETLDSLFYSYYPKDAEREKAKVFFINEFKNFSFKINIKKEHIELIENQLYKGNNLVELQKNTKYMNKNIDILEKMIIENRIPEPIIMFKNNAYHVLTGRTRMSIMKIKNIPFSATIIDYKKMMTLFNPTKELHNEFIVEGLGVFCLEDKTFRKRLLYFLKNNQIEECINLEGYFWSIEDNSKKIEILEELKIELRLIDLPIPEEQLSLYK